MKKYIKNDKILKVKYRVKINKIWQNFKHFNSKIKGKIIILKNNENNKNIVAMQMHMKKKINYLKNMSFML